MDNFQGKQRLTLVIQIYAIKIFVYLQESKGGAQPIHISCNFY